MLATCLLSGLDWVVAGCEDDRGGHRLGGASRNSAAGSRPSLFSQYERVSTQDYRDGRKDNSRCKLRDLFYFWCGLLLAWRRRQRRWLLWWLRR